MAISKILYIGDCGAGYSDKHLKQAIDYITVREKTGDGRWIAAVNCQCGNQAPQGEVLKQMRLTKQQFGKTDKRQGYHLIISFAEGEVDAETAFEVIGKFTKEYLGKDYEAVYAVHDNTAHIHGHVIFNSVSFRTGNKYRYKKGDWAKQIQPITNRLCEEYGLSTIELSDDRAKPSEHYQEWNDFREGKFIWSDMIKRDLDSCMKQALTYESFLVLLYDMGYQIKHSGKYLAIKPMGMSRYRRCKSLGEEYSESRIRERIQTESISTVAPLRSGDMPRIVRCRIKRYRRAKLSGVQKRYFTKLYRLGKLKKRPYSQAFQYRDELRKMKRLQEDYLFLSRHQIGNSAELTLTVEQIREKKKEVSKEKNKLYKERARYQSLFAVMEELLDLKEFENCFKRGEELFSKEHERWGELTDKLKREGYTMESLQMIKAHYRNEIAAVSIKEKEITKAERIAGRLLTELSKRNVNKKMTENPNISSSIITEANRERNRNVSKDRQR